MAESITEKNQDKVGQDDVVNPWNVSTSSATGIDYDKLIGLFALHPPAN